MPSFANLDSFDCAHPVGLSGLCDPLPAKLVSQFRGGNEVAKRHNAVSVFIDDVNHPPSQIEGRGCFNKLGHSATLPSSLKALNAEGMGVVNPRAENNILKRRVGFA